MFTWIHSQGAYRCIYVFASNFSMHSHLLPYEKSGFISNTPCMNTPSNSWLITRPIRRVLKTGGRICGQWRKSGRTGWRWVPVGVPLVGRYGSENDRLTTQPTPVIPGSILLRTVNKEFWQRFAFRYQCIRIRKRTAEDSLESLSKYLEGFQNSAVSSPRGWMKDTAVPQGRHLIICGGLLSWWISNLFFRNDGWTAHYCHIKKFDHSWRLPSSQLSPCLRAQCRVLPSLRVNLWDLRFKCLKILINSERQLIGCWSAM